MLHVFRVVPFSCCTFLCVAPIPCGTFSRVASCCTLFMLHFLGIQASSFLKNRLHRRCFPVKFVKFLRTPILENISERLFQKMFSNTLSMSKSHNIVKLQRMNGFSLFRSEAVVQRCSVKKMFWGLRPATLLKKSFWYRCFSVSFTKFLRTPFFTKHFRWLLLSDFSLFGIQIYL